MTDDTRWMDSALCAQIGTDWWFPDDGPGGHSRARRQSVRPICGGCPVRQPCLDWAIRTQPTTGIWAGYTARQIRRGDIQ